MYKPLQRPAKPHQKQKALHLNINKLQAALCLMASAAVSIGLIYLGIQSVI